MATRIDPNRRKPPALPAPPRPARVTLRRVSKKRAELMKTLSPDRRELKEEVGECMWCGVPYAPDALDVHEIAAGGSREKCLTEPLLLMVLCRHCHGDIQGKPPAKQIAVLTEWSIDRICKAYCDVKGLAPRAVSRSDVTTFLFFRKPPKSKRKGKA